MLACSNMWARLKPATLPPTMMALKLDFEPGILDNIGSGYMRGQDCWIGL